MADILHLESPAKVNLRLDILRKREDGYHEIRTILQKISLYDSLHFSLKKGRGISIKTDHPELPVGRGNLVYQAVESMLRRGGYKGGVIVEIEKRIPLGAGLGGGSSNAAVALKAMNQLLEINLGKKELMAIGLEMGADIPFFFFNGAAIASGIGERLRRIELPRLWYVLIYPNFEVSTRWAYQNFVLTKSRFRFNLRKLLGSPEEVSRLLSNDLEGVVSKRHPQIEQMKRILYAAGAIGASMTGSGPTVFGIYPDEGGAIEAYEKIRRMVRGKGWIVLKAKSLLA
ncbi:MAG: 4-(cytidine 5'-diphospho)-2-C-methyl-D-erythritol kinase [Syntrophaceae bacterium]|nr:4-(cytidine 5'-diphospho)-2-C-methyl-D-erythritol kinase [Syntrophaceae bacterium]